MLDEKKSLRPKCLLCMKMKNDLRKEEKYIVIWCSMFKILFYFISYINEKKFGCAVLKILGNKGLN